MPTPSFYRDWQGEHWCPINVEEGFEACPHDVELWEFCKTREGRDNSATKRGGNKHREWIRGTSVDAAHCERGRRRSLHRHGFWKGICRGECYQCRVEIAEILGQDNIPHGTRDLILTAQTFPLNAAFGERFDMFFRRQLEALARKVNRSALVSPFQAIFFGGEADVVQLPPYDHLGEYVRVAGAGLVPQVQNGQ
jgi:hypothetical protein